MAGYTQQIDIAVIVPLPPATRLDSVLDALQVLLDRHEGLRTTYPARSDGQPVQRVMRDVVVPVTLYELGPGRSGSPTAARDFSRLLRGVDAFNPDAIPVHLAVALREGRPGTLYIVVSHLSIDFWAATVIREEFLSILAGGVPALRPVGLQPLDRAELERSDEASTVARRSLDFIAGQLADAAHPQLPGPLHRPARPRFWMADMFSPAAALALGAIARTMRVSPPAALLGVYCSLMATWAGLDRFTVRTVVGNRLTDDDFRYVGQLSQHSLITVRAGDDLAQWIHVAARRLVASVRHARYPRPALEDVLLAEAAARGAKVDLGCTYNFIQNGVELAGSHQAAKDFEDPEGLRDTLARLRRETTLRWWDAVERENYRLALTAWGYPDRFMLRLQADTADMSQAGIMSLLATLEHALCSVALGCTDIHAAAGAGSAGW